MNAITEKIKKLIAKAKSVESISESQMFMAKANELLLKHGVSINSIENTSKQGNLTGSTDGIKYDEKSSEGRWEDLLISVLCSNNLCEAIIHPQDKTLTVIGRPENVETTIYMFEVARDVFRKDSLKRYKEYRIEMLSNAEIDYPDLSENELKKNKYMSYPNPFRRGYYKGAVNGLHEKLEEQRASVIKKEHGREEEQRIDLKKKGLDTKSIIPFGNKLQRLKNEREEEIKEFKELNFKNLKKTSKVRRSSEKDAYTYGVEDGKSLEFNKGIDLKDDKEINLLG